jgi:hypothetical protein
VLVIIALNNSLKKRVELASKAAADFLNHKIFTASGPVKSLAGYLGATGEHAGECLLQKFIPDGYSQSIFPYSDSESGSKPLVKGKYLPELHLAIGCLRIFNAKENSADAGGAPFCNFHSDTSAFVTGAACLDPYGPLFFVMARQILPKLCPMLGDLFCNAKTREEVEKAMTRTFTR